MVSKTQSYAEVGKSAQDLFTRDFFVRGVKVEAKTTAANGVTFQLDGMRDNATQVVSGDIRTKYQNKSRGLTITESCGTSKVLSAEFELADTVTKGLKFRLAAKLNSPKNKQATVFGYELRKGMLVHRLDVDLGGWASGLVGGANQKAADDCYAAEISTSATVTHANVTVGVDTTFFGSALKKCNFALGYNAGAHVLAFHATDQMSGFALSYHQKIGTNIEASARTSVATKNGRTGDVLLEAAGKLSLDGDAFVKGKVDSFGRVGLSYVQNLRPGVRAALSCAIDTTRLAEAAHKTGLVLTFEA